MFEGMQKNWVLIFGIVILLAVAFAYLGGIFQTSFLIFGVMSAVILAIALFFHKKNVKFYQMNEIKDKAMPILQEFGEATESGAKIKGIYRLDDNLTVDPSGRTWQVTAEGHSDNILLFDAKTGEPYVAEFHAEGTKSPLEKTKEPKTEIKFPNIKRKTTEEVKPN